ncbi:hypothetical protein K469DRAFT_83060 [Zopfia rhizophila CBS 207.26]|uniref:BZIP domain-containing protein n=1 Tax=Zopfia rhizophila CBS 207.26 TaxID=1314779 RepID=A0A6A6E9K5_9PEZI|nr:hypothetical protein K469DRAFT_83060 [Zopfia rhizophila CBS 207.26]
MSRKNKDTPFSVRIRENQRRSRTRRKELLEDLQKRVQEFELNGVTATQEMQRAARIVAQENVRLRSLLARHGVSREEVDSYLRSFDEGSTTNDSPVTNVRALLSRQSGASERIVPSPASSAVRPSSHSGTENSSTSTHAGQNSKHDGQDILDERRSVSQSRGQDQEKDSTTQQPESTALHGSPRAATKLTSAICRAADDRSNAHETCGAEDCVHEFPVAEKSDLCPSDSDCFCPHVTTARDELLTSGLETSCETAVRIITEMRGDEDRDLVRASLGCSGRDDCYVKNTTVFQVMGGM